MRKVGKGEGDKEDEEVEEVEEVEVSKGETGMGMG